MNVGERIKELRIKHGLTQKQLAEIAKISNSYLCDIEVGRTNPSLKTLEKICKAFDFDLKDLL